MGRSLLLENPLQLSRGPRGRAPRRKPSDDARPPVPLMETNDVRLCLEEKQGLLWRLRGWKPKVRTQYSDDDERGSARDSRERDRLAEHRRIAREPAKPEGVAQHGARR